MFLELRRKKGVIKKERKKWKEKVDKKRKKKRE